MRITNKIIQNNSLTNINTNKALEDKLSTMISSEKKISRPSDDPIIALRSLRLRTSVNQTTQYAEKNVEDAKSWLTVTEDAIDTLTDIITDVRAQYNKATSDQLQSGDRRIIIENLESLAAEIYNTGNVDFAGRSVFTGYRTESTLTFQTQADVNYTIEETEKTASLDRISFVHQGDAENDVYTESLQRIRLSYNSLTDTAPTVLVTQNGVETNLTLTVKASSDDPYAYAKETDGAVVYIPETGEIIFNEKAEISEEAEYKVTYNKEQWKSGDLRPEHYFNCYDNTNGIQYSSHSGEIKYNVGVNQSLRINTTPDECFSHSIVRDLQDVVNALKETEDIESRITEIETEIKGYDETETAKIKDANIRLDAAKKAKTFIDDKLHTMLSETISKAQGYLDANNVALTNCGTRSKRLELIENRLDTQLESLKELKSENEDADIAETAILLSSAQYAYDAALLATSKIIKESLLNYV